MRLTLLLLLAIIILSAPDVLSQKQSRSERKLSRLFERGKYEKCKRKAIKFRKKEYSDPVPVYYISKIEMRKFSESEHLSIMSRFRILKNAARYSQRLPDAYDEWKMQVKNNYEDFVVFYLDSVGTQKQFKSILKQYSKLFGDSLKLAFQDMVQEREENNLLDFDSVPNVDSLRKIMLIAAKECVGVPYKYAGEEPETGFDCSGFTKYIYEQIDIELPHNAHKQSLMPAEIIGLEEALPGDLIFFGYKGEDGHSTSHAGIFFSESKNETKVIHCVSGGVKIDGNNSSWDHYWKDRVTFVKRFPQLDN